MKILITISLKEALFLFFLVNEFGLKFEEKREVIETYSLNDDGTECFKKKATTLISNNFLATQRIWPCDTF